MKSKITNKIKENNLKPSLIPFLVSGFPNLEVTKNLILSFDKINYISAIEVGVPFSDPLADGPVIQIASKEALANGTNLTKILEMLVSIKDEISTPIILFTYVNTVINQGIENFFKLSSSAGVSGVIIPDLPLEESEKFLDYCNLYNIELIMLVAPTSDRERIKNIASVSKGFIYLVSSTGVTGVREGFSSLLSELIKNIKIVSDIPVCVGFGVSKTEHIQELKELGVEGAIIGSAIIKVIDKNKHVPENIVNEVNKYIGSLYNTKIGISK